jgi:hypothetical protein
VCRGLSFRLVFLAQNDYENAAKIFDPHLHQTGVNQVRAHCHRCSVTVI